MPQPSIGYAKIVDGYSSSVIFGDLLGKARLSSLLAGLEGSIQTKLGWHTVDAVESVQVLVNNHLVAGSKTITRSDNRPGEEKFPDLKRTKLDILKSMNQLNLLTLYQRAPYLALMASTLPTQLRYHLQRVPE